MTDIELFDKCIEVVLKNEGGYVNHPADPGGETNYGICKRYFPDEDIKNLTKKRAKKLYFDNFWKPMSLWDIINPEIILQIFDFGINAGKRRAIKSAQKIVNVAQDGICGKMTTNSINEYPDNFLEKYKIERRYYYTNLAKRKPELKVFLRGWINRIDKTKLGGT